MGATGGAGGIGGIGTDVRSPQSVQSFPKVQAEKRDPGPPSSHALSEAWKQLFPHTISTLGGIGGGTNGEGEGGADGGGLGDAGFDGV